MAMTTWLLAIWNMIKICEFVTMNSWWLMIIMLCYEYEHCRSRNFMSYYVAYRFLFALHLHLSMFVHVHSIPLLLFTKAGHWTTHTKWLPCQKTTYSKKICLRKGGEKKWKKQNLILNRYLLLVELFSL